jgi:hypothetical protein
LGSAGVNPLKTRSTHARERARSVFRAGVHRVWLEPIRKGSDLSDPHGLIAHFIAHLIEKWAVPTKCAIKSPWKRAFRRTSG